MRKSSSVVLHIFLINVLFILGNRSDCIIAQKVYETKIHVGTFLGNEKRNFYGNEAPSKLDTIWKIYLGEGVSPAYGNSKKVWKGAGWTGQPLVVEENGEFFLIQGSYDYNLKKIKAENGEIVWQYKFDDIIKGTGTLYHNKNAKNIEERYIIIQGSRRGINTTINSKYCPSLRGISYSTGRELWRMDVKQTLSYSRDVDGSALIVDDVAYLALENGIFTVFSPNPENQTIRNELMQPKILKEITFFNEADTILHGKNVESESSPCYLNGRIYTTSGSGRIYGYNIIKDTIDWVFEIGSDLNGSPVVTSDSCLLIPVEKQFIKGKGGVFKLNPLKKPEESVVWYYPVENRIWFHWEGGIIGSVSINDYYFENSKSNLAAFIGVDGNLVVVDHKSINNDKLVFGPDNIKKFKTPRTVFIDSIGGTIATPIIVKDKLIAPLDSGLYLYQYDEKYNFTLLDKFENIQLDATPVTWNGRLFVASMNGYLYCFGKQKK